MKNSWGTNWGENGYIKVKMGTCGIDSTVSIPFHMDPVEISMVGMIFFRAAL